MSVEKAVAAVIEPVVAEHGLFLEAVTAKRAGDRQVIRVTVDLPDDVIGAVDADALDAVSRAVSGALDNDDVVPGAYVLEVSTSGTSRPLTELRHFKRARTRLVNLVLANGDSLQGRLVDVSGGDDPSLVFDDGTKVPLSTVRRGRVEVELKRLDDETTE